MREIREPVHDIRLEHKKRGQVAHSDAGCLKYPVGLWPSWTSADSSIGSCGWRASGEAEGLGTADTAVVSVLKLTGVEAGEPEFSACVCTGVNAVALGDLTDALLGVSRKGANPPFNATLGGEIGAFALPLSSFPGGGDSGLAVIKAKRGSSLSDTATC